jgi:hypothetical protein
MLTFSLDTNIIIFPSLFSFSTEVRNESFLHCLVPLVALWPKGKETLLVYSLNHTV